MRKVFFILVILGLSSCSKVAEEELPNPQRQEELPNPMTPGRK